LKKNGRANLVTFFNEKLQEFAVLRFGVVVTVGQGAVPLTVACAHYLGDSKFVDLLRTVRTCNHRPVTRV